MRVAHIRKQRGPGFVEVIFLESARFYKLLGNNPAYEEILQLLRDAMKKGRVVKVEVASPDSDILEDAR